MASIGSLLGVNGGAGGTGFSTPSNTNLLTPTTNGQINTAYGNTQGSMAQQQSLLNALQGQNGLANQSSVYNQLQGVVNGTGPNPAQAQLAQATGQNVSNQTAMMAGQRGSNANVGLMARQAAQQGAQTQQQSAGQAANLQANQSLNALQGLGNIANTQVGNQIGQTNSNTQAQQSEQANLANAAAGLNSANVGMQSNINNVNGQLANTQMQGQQALLGGLLNSGSSMMSGAQGGKVPNDLVSMPTTDVQYFDDGGDVAPAPEQTPGADFGSFSPAAAPAATQTAATPSFGSDAGAAAFQSKGGSGGGGGGMSSMMGLLAMMAEGGDPGQAQTTQSSQSGVKSKFGQFLKNGVKNQGQQTTPEVNYGNAGANALYQGVSSMGSALMKPSQGSTPYPQQNVSQIPETGVPAQHISPEEFFKGGKVPALVSPGEQYLPPKDVKKVLKEGKNPLKQGERIPGKPKFPGNDYRNDTVPKTLDAGGIVIPNKIMQGPNPHWQAMRFVHATMKKNKHSGKK